MLQASFLVSVSYPITVQLNDLMFSDCLLECERLPIIRVCVFHFYP